MAEAHDPWTLTARWVFPVAGPPLERGTVTVEGERIIAVEPQRVRTADHDLGNVAILPGLVNTHTHLDLSGMRGLAPPSPDFIGWLRKVVAHRRARSPDQVQDDIQVGIDECVRFGTTLLGDIAGEGASWDALADAPIRAVVFHEILGLSRERVDRALVVTEAWVEAHQTTATCQAGLSPHAPYSVRDLLFVEAANGMARWRGLTLAIHLAETLIEVELLRSHTGPFVEFLSELGVWDPEGLVDSPEAVIPLCHLLLPPIGALWVHCNYLDPSVDIPQGDTIVYCPRTHAAFGHPPHPFREFLKRGVRVALGTDSLASNPDLDLLAEARFLHARYPDVPGATVLRMATLSGAEALCWADETGSLEPGKSADLVVLPLPNEERTDPHDLILQSMQPVQRALWRGQWREAAQPAS